MVIPIKLVGPNTAVFGTRTHTLDLTLQWPRPATVEILFSHPLPGVILAVVVVVNKLVEPNTAVFGITYSYTEHCSVGSTNLLTTIITNIITIITTIIDYYQDEKGTKDFYGGRKGAIRKILFIYFLFYIIFN